MKTSALTRKFFLLSGGSISIFFAGLILPFLFFLFALSIDITKYFRETQRAQKALDDAALYAYKFLPYQARAAQAAQSYLQQMGSSSQGLDVRVDGDSIELALNSQSQLSFAGYFMPEGAVSLTAYARVRGTPFDTLIAVDSSSYLAPQLSEEPWGSAQDWPAADFFRAGYPYPCLKDNGTLEDPRNLTQLCFNEAFSALKLAALRAYEYLAGFQSNAVGVGFFPGSGELWFDEVRPVQFGRTTVPGWGEAVFKNYVRYCGSSEYCAAAAEREVGHEAYKFQTPNRLIEGSWSPPPNAPPMILSGEWRFNPDYQTYLRTSEAIWSRVAVQELPYIDQLLSEILVRIIPPFFEERGGLKNRPEKTGIVFAGDVPHLGAARFLNSNDAVAAALAAGLEQFRVVLRDNPDFSLKLFYVVLGHNHSPPELGQRFSALQTFFDEQAALDPALAGRFELRALMAQDPETLARRLAGELVLEKKNAVLSR